MKPLASSPLPNLAVVAARSTKPVAADVQVRGRKVDLLNKAGTVVSKATDRPGRPASGMTPTLAVAFGAGR